MSLSGVYLKIMNDNPVMYGMRIYVDPMLKLLTPGMTPEETVEREVKLLLDENIFKSL